jgi:hypothetical protein
MCSISCNLVLAFPSISLHVEPFASRNSMAQAVSPNFRGGTQAQANTNLGYSHKVDILPQSRPVVASLTSFSQGHF